MTISIQPFALEYVDTLISMILEAKRAPGRTQPTVKSDLLDIPASYFDQGDMYWIALDEDGNLVAGLGYASIPDSSEVWLRRFYVRHDLKRQGIGSDLLAYAEDYLRTQEKTCARVHLGEDYYESHHFYPKHGYQTYAPLYMKKGL